MSKRVFMGRVAVLACCSSLLAGCGLQSLQSLLAPNPIDQFESRFDRLSQSPDTLDMPVTGTANYRGQTLLFLPERDIIADLDLAVAFAPGSDGTVSGTAQNFRWEENPLRLNPLQGSLSTEGAPPSRVTVVETMAGGGTVERRGTLSVNMAGTLEMIGGEVGTGSLALDGRFFGPDAAGAIGEADLIMRDSAGVEVVNSSGQGEFFLQRR